MVRSDVASSRFWLQLWSSRSVQDVDSLLGLGSLLVQSTFFRSALWMTTITATKWLCRTIVSGPAMDAKRPILGLRCSVGGFSQTLLWTVEVAMAGLGPRAELRVIPELPVHRLQVLVDPATYWLGHTMFIEMTFKASVSEDHLEGREILLQPRRVVHQQQRTAPLFIAPTRYNFGGTARNLSHRTTVASS